MGIFDGFLGKNHGPVMTTVEPRLACAHSRFIPHWERVKDIGDEDKADWFTCDDCNEHFSLTDVQSRRIAADWRLHEEFFSRAESGDLRASGFPDSLREGSLVGATGKGTVPFADSERTESPSGKTALRN